MNRIFQHTNLEKLQKNLKFQFFISLTAILFFLEIIFTGNDSLFITLISELVVILAVSSLTLYFIELLQERKINPISLAMNIGILSGILFFMVSFSEFIITSLFKNILQTDRNQGLIYSLVYFFYSMFILVTASYIFYAFRELYYLKRKKPTSAYYLTMVIFFILAGITAGLNNNEDLKFIPTTFFVVSIILISLNSLKISWIAFLTKKEKISLLVLAVLISILFVVNLVNNSNKEVHSHILVNFSPALHQFVNLVHIYGIIYFGILFFTTLFHLPTADAYDRKAREVSSLQYFSNLINQMMDFNDLEDTITDLALKVANADSSWVAWYKDNEIKTRALKNIGIIESKQLSEYVLDRTGPDSITNTTLFNLESYSNRMDFAVKYKYAAVSGLRTCNGAQGFLFVTLNGNTIFDDEDVSAINTFAEYSSVAVENCSLMNENIEKERLEKELDVAREIQRKILPVDNPETEDISVSSVFIPAFEVGGDYYDFFKLDDNKMGFVIADVSGKGISAAFIMAEIKGIFESLSRIISSPRDILIKANDILKNTLDRKNFVSAAYGVIDIRQGRLTIARAGHCPVLLLRDNKALEIRPGGLGLGLNYSGYFSDTLEETAIDLKENDTIVLYTDGITEAKNSDLEDFGNTTFERILLENTGKTAQEISNAVIKQVSLFSQSISQHDDITLVILKWKQKNKSDGETEWQNSAQQLKIKVT